MCFFWREHIYIHIFIWRACVCVCVKNRGVFIYISYISRVFSFYFVHGQPPKHGYSVGGMRRGGTARKHILRAIYADHLAKLRKNPDADLQSPMWQPIGEIATVEHYINKGDRAFAENYIIENRGLLKPTKRKRRKKKNKYGTEISKGGFKLFLKKDHENHENGCFGECCYDFVDHCEHNDPKIDVPCRPELPTI